MSYFFNFPLTPYRYGSKGQDLSLVQNLAAYVQIVDEIRDNVAFYTKYTIQDGDRPDQVSNLIYGTTDYYFTFFLMNDGIREQGWPLSNREIESKVKKDRPDFTLTTRSPLSGVFKIGQTVEGLSSGARGKILRRRLDLGQIIVKLEGTTKFTGSEVIRSDNGAGFDNATLVGATGEWQSVHHYENADKEHADIDPAQAPGAQLTPVTYLDLYKQKNDDLRNIRVIKPQSVAGVYRAFQEAMQS